VGLTHPADLDAWRRWHDRRHPVRLARDRVRRALPFAAAPALVDVRRGGADADIVVAVEATHASVRAAVVEVVGHLDPARVVVVAPAGTDLLIGPTGPTGPVTTIALPDLGAVLGPVRAVLAAGHYTPIGAAVHEHARRVGAAFVVSQHGLLTPVAPPLPPRCRLLAWSDADADFWTSGRDDVAAEVVGSQLLWNAGEVTTGSTADHGLVYLGQLHAAELSRRDLARAAGAFCRDHHATYRPHPSERDRISRLLHARWRRQGVRIDDGAVPLTRLEAPVVSVFSTGVLEAAARGLPAWVDLPSPPAWLEEFWERYGLRRFGDVPTSPPSRPGSEPARAIARILEETT
jgi:hypothetical protein